jgi:hypothetical protein
LNLFFLFILVFLVAACQPKALPCPPETGVPRYITALPTQDSSMPTPSASQAPVTIEIAGKKVKVDKIVAGPLCNDHWSGTVYVTCNVQIFPWTEKPTFLKDCNLEIEPGTVVYVAHHNNTPYYNGCSCHTSDTPTP